MKQFISILLKLLHSYAFRFSVSLFFFSVAFTVRASDDITQSKPVYSFNEIHISHAVKLVITFGGDHSLKVEGEKNVLDDVEIEEKNNVLSIGMKDGSSHHNSGVTAYVTCKSLKALRSSGAGSIETTNLLKGESLTITSSGASKFVLKLDVDNLEANVNGASHLSLSGKSEKAELIINGASGLKAGDFEVGEMELKCSGASSASVNVTKSLDVHASGASSVKYSGNATVKKDVSGVSSIKNTGS